MKKLLVSLLLSIIAIPAYSATQFGFQLESGVFDVVKRVNRANSAGFRLIGPSGPQGWSMAGGFHWTSEGSRWIYIGTQGDFFQNKPYGMSLLISASTYKDGGETDLGFPIEFFESIEFYYKLTEKQSIGIAIQHLSNAGLGDRNPGVENIMITYRVSNHFQKWLK